LQLVDVGHASSSPFVTLARTPDARTRAITSSSRRNKTAAPGGNFRKGFRTFRRFRRSTPADVVRSGNYAVADPDPDTATPMPSARAATPAAKKKGMCWFGIIGFGIAAISSFQRVAS
jgi:hypothetical protein